MTQAIRCPSCGKRFTVRSELIGKRLRCSACKEPFTADPDGELHLAPPAAAPSSPAPVRAVSHPAIVPPRQRASPSADRPPIRMGLLKLGGSFVTFGVLALILPLFGIQLRKINMIAESGGDPITAAFIFIGFGGLLCLLAIMRRYGRRIAAIGGGIVLLLFILPMGRGRLGCGRSAHPTPSQLGPAFPDHRIPSVPVTYEGMVKAYGSGRVVRVIATTASNRVAKDPALYKKLWAALQAGGAFTGTSSPVGTRLEFIAAPVEDMDVVARNLPSGEAILNRSTRTIELDMSAESAPASAATRPATTLP